MLHSVSPPEYILLEGRALTVHLLRWVCFFFPQRALNNTFNNYSFLTQNIPCGRHLWYLLFSLYFFLLITPLSTFWRANVNHMPNVWVKDWLIQWIQWIGCSFTEIWTQTCNKLNMTRVHFSHLWSSEGLYFMPPPALLEQPNSFPCWTAPPHSVSLWDIHTLQMNFFPAWTQNHFIFVKPKYLRINICISIGKVLKEIENIFLQANKILAILLRIYFI